MKKSLTYSDPLISSRRQVVILSILIMDRITDRMLLWDTSISYSLGSETALFICIWKVQSSRKFFMKMGSLPSRPRFMSMPYSHDVS